jgi:cell fate regulator YaaT (PSP1 superfamily)
MMENYVTGHIHYELSEEDLRMQKMLSDRVPQTRKTVQAAIDHLSLQMKLVDVEYLFAGERVVVYYLAEDRVDFRQLIKDLGGQLQTRIEMKQIGVRDEAKLLADYGDCGKPLCCNTHLSTMPRVTMKMAKLQKASLDPNKLSGRCGRLKCCLRYEFDHYEEVFDRLPAIGSRVLTREGTLTVLQHEILTQQLLVETQDRRRLLIPASDVLSEVPR